jgi:sulfonate transport system substrate-binding protein
MKIGLVPEHYSAPLYYGSQEESKESQEMELISCPGGTGQMLKSLNSGHIDCAIMLTEGALAGLQHDSPWKIIGVFEQNPLVWSISVSKDCSFSKDDLNLKTFGISRFGSGSHIMALILQKRWGIQLKFKELNTFTNMLDELENGTIDAFMWEKFTTMPYYQDRRIKLLDHFSPDWPSFLIAMNNSKLENVTLFQDAIQNCINLYKQNQDAALDYVMNDSTFYYPSHSELLEWSLGVSFPNDLKVVNRAAINSCLDSLSDCGIRIDKNLINVAFHSNVKII